METKTTTSEPEVEVVQEAAPPRKKPRKLSTTDKLRELHEQASRKVEVLRSRADRQRDELAATVKALSEARLELERLDATLPQVDEQGRVASPGVNEKIAQLADRDHYDVVTSQRSNGATSAPIEATFEVDP